MGTLQHSSSQITFGSTCFYIIEDSNISNIVFDHIVQLIKLQQLEDNKSLGPDGIHSALLKNCDTTVAAPLAMIFQKSFVFWHTHTHTTVLLLVWNMSGSTRVSRYQKGKIKKVKTNLDLLEQETVSVSGICWAICNAYSLRPPARSPSAGDTWVHLP